MPEITVDRHYLMPDVSLHVEDTGGPGRPVVLIHGWPLSGASWSQQVQPLAAAGHRVITYDRRGFGRSDQPKTGYDYDTLAEDLSGLLEALDLRDVTLVGFSMGGGEVARYVAEQGEERLHGVVFAAAVPPMLVRTEDNPQGPLEESEAQKMAEAVTEDREAFFEGFITDFFSADGQLKVTDEQRREALELCRQADRTAVLETMKAFATTDFRTDLTKISVPTLVIHGDSDGTVPLEGSGARTHEAVPHSELHVIAGGPHGVNVSHAADFNEALLGFLGR